MTTLYWEFKNYETEKAVVQDNIFTRIALNSLNDILA